ncbi:hypothetical protein IIC_04505 [Bacillus cereus VD021]|uniref:Cas12f1-like TNB domain-containing protein n=1 Tax=Bacillus cereus VD021 TaxID=1053224 RepID=R8HDV7_BACCE|nr:hypothetical protein IIC_04505 [Bacillus cereus VD021]
MEISSIKSAQLSWHLDEAYIKVKEEWRYLYHAIDKDGHTLDLQLRKKRDYQAAYDFMKGMSQSLNFGKSVADSGWGMFTSFLAYKLQEQGKQLVKIDKWFPSTKTCSNCGIVKDISLSERVYSCICGVNLDRDYNSAINIKNEAIRLLALA